MDVLNKIKQLQEERGWSRAQLAEKAGLAPSTISTMYKRNNLPTIPTLQAICNALNITVSQFFADTNLPLDLTTEQKHLLEHWNRLNEKQKSAILSLIKSI